MSTRELLERVSNLAIGENLDWNRTRAEIVEAHRHASEQEREALLKLYKVVMDSVEGNGQLSTADLATFRKARREEYNLMLISVCAMPDGNVSPEALRIITEREVAAGRMAPDDELRRLAIGGPEAMDPERSPPPKRSGWFGLGRKK